MRIPLLNPRVVAVLAWSLVLQVGGPAGAKSGLNTLQAVDLRTEGDARRIEVRTQSAPVFTVFRLANPMRVVIDISGGDVGALESPIELDDGVVAHIALRQFRADSYSIARVTVTFNESVSYDVRAEGRSVVLRASREALGLQVRSLAPPARPLPDLNKLRKERRRAETMAEEALAASQKAEAQARARRQEAENLAKRVAGAEAEKNALAEQLQHVQSAHKADVQRALKLAEARETELRAAQAQAKANDARAQEAAEKARQSNQKAAQEMARVRDEYQKLATELERQRKDAVQAKQAAEAARREVEAAQARVRSAENQAQKAKAEAQANARLKQEATATLSRVEREKKAVAAQAAAIEAREAELSARARELSARERKIAGELAELESEKADFQDKITARKAEATKLASLGTPDVSAANALTSIRQRGNEVFLQTARFPVVASERIDGPPRLVIDLKNTRRDVGEWSYDFNGGLAKGLRLGPHGSTLRAVIDLKDASVQHALLPESSGVRIRLKTGSGPTHPKDSMRLAKAPPAKPVAKPAAAPAPQPATQPARRSKPRRIEPVAKLQDLRFSGSGARQVLTLYGLTHNHYELDDRSQRSWLLKLRHTELPKTLEKSLDTQRFDGPVAMVSSYQAEPGTVNVVLRLREDADGVISRVGNTLTWTVVARRFDESASQMGVAGFASQAASLSSAVPTQSRQQRVTIKFRDAELVEVVRFIAEGAGQNVIVASDVKGKVTLNLRNVPWKRALDVILRSRGYDSVIEDGIMRVAKTEALQAELEAKIKEREKKALLELPVTRIFTLNYASADDARAQLKELLSERGAVSVEKRSNSLVVQDVPTRLREIRRLIQQLDTQTPQVLIEARIVEASSNLEQELGIQWGGGSISSGATGNPTGIGFPGTIGLAGGADGTGGGTQGLLDTTTLGSNSVFQPGGFAINLPAAVGSGSGGALGIILGSADGNHLLNLRLSALESSGKGRIISAPRVTTLHNLPATISQGTRIPISVVSAAGVNTRFINADLELKVTPQVTNDGNILMEINTTKNEPDFQNTGASGDPTILTKEASTNVLVRDGDTAVIGGIYTRNRSENINGVPVLSKIPILGFLFKKTRKIDLRSELLIFITPRIVNREASRVDNSATISVPVDE